MVILWTLWRLLGQSALLGIQTLTTRTRSLLSSLIRHNSASLWVSTLITDECGTLHYSVLACKKAKHVLTHRKKNVLPKQNNVVCWGLLPEPLLFFHCSSFGLNKKAKDLKIDLLVGFVIYLLFKLI